MQKSNKSTLVGERVKNKKTPWKGTVAACGSDHFSEKKGKYGAWVSRWNERKENKAPTHYWLSTPTSLLIEITHDKSGNSLKKCLWVVLEKDQVEFLGETETIRTPNTNPIPHAPIGSYVEVIRHEHGWEDGSEGYIVSGGGTCGIAVIKNLDNGMTVECSHRRDYYVRSIPK